MTNSIDLEAGSFTRISYSIVIPAYNEAERIPETLKTLLFHIRQHHWNAEIIVVDDGSTDDTVKIVKDFAIRTSLIRIVENGVHNGKGYSVCAGMRNAVGELVLLVDADLPVSITEAFKLFDGISRGADIAIGSRRLERSTYQCLPSLARRVASYCFSLLIRYLLRLPLQDTQCGFKAFRRDAAQLIFPLIRTSGWTFDVEALYLASRIGMRIEEIPVTIRHDPRSKLHLLKDSLGMFGELCRVLRRSLLENYPRLDLVISRADEMMVRAGRFRRISTDLMAALVLLALAFNISRNEYHFDKGTSQGSLSAIQPNRQQASKNKVVLFPDDARAAVYDDASAADMEYSAGEIESL